MAARFHIIILDQNTTEPATRPTYRVAYWADVPTVRQPFYANAAAKSAWTGALAADTAQLVSGAVVEMVVCYSPEASKTLAQMQADVQAIYAAYQAKITPANSWARYGTTWDGVTWVAGGVA